MALTAKQEVFCQGVAVRKMNQSEAYSCAYDISKMTPGSIATAASMLMNNEKVASRIDVLKGKVEAAAVKSALLSREQSLDEAGRLLEQAQATGQVSAGVAAAKLRAQLSGHLDEKKGDPKDSLDQMDIDGLLELRKAVEEKVRSSREALELTGDAAPAEVKPVAAPIRRVI